MTKKDRLYNQAEMMFIELGQTAKAIAETLEVQEKTIGKWRSDGEWDKRREQLLASPHKIKELLLKEVQSIIAGNAPSFNADALRKVSVTLENMDDKVNPRVAITVLKMLDDFTAEIDPGLAAKSLPVHKKFILHIINIYGN